ncbi:MAG: carboxypeptidase-like regulatory domain-containing protein [Saprospiraceae bacterium]
MSEFKAIGGIPDSQSETIKTGKNYLFAIGINTYQHFTPLLNARKDIVDLSQLLVDQYYFDAQDVQLICDLEATKDNIIDQLDGLRRKVKPEDRLLIYYSGHGYTDIDRGFWIPVDAEPNRVSSYIANAEVRDIIQSIKAKHILLISDSCFSASLLVRDIVSDLAGTAFVDWERNPSRWAFISGKGVVSDGKAGENSPFAGGILKHLRYNDDDAINILRLADQVTQEIRFNYEQQAEVSPLFQAGHGGGQFVFVKKQTEKDEWQSALNHPDEGSFLEYLNKYPEGKFVKEADQKLADIADENEWASASLRNAAFAYRQYLKIYPKGKHIEEAERKLDAIEKEDRLEKEEARKREQDRVFKLELERKAIEQAGKSELANKLKQINPTKKVDIPTERPHASNPTKQTNYRKYIFAIIGLGIVVAVIWMINGNKVSLASGIESSLPIDTIVDVQPTVLIADSSREIEGKVLDSKSTPNPLIGAIVLNKRNGTSTATDENGNFKLSGAKDGDTLLTTYVHFSEAINIILKDQKSGIIQLQELPPATPTNVNKTISGTVTDRNGTVITGAWVYIKRNGQIIKPYTHTNNSGKYTLSKVKEGDILWIDSGTKYKKKSFVINSSDEYPCVVN